MWYTQRDDVSLNSTKEKRRKQERLLRVQASSHGMVLAVEFVF
jgi:hypothetical protein